MSLLALAFVVVVLALAGVALRHPWIGMLGYTWLSLMIPHRLIGGAVFNLPAAKLLALATLIGLLTTRERYRLPQVREIWILAAFYLVCLASTALNAFHPEPAWSDLNAFTKAVVMLLPPLLLMQSATRLRAWVMTIALSLGALGVGSGARAIATGLNERLWGPEGSILGDNNALAFALVVAVPLLIFLCRAQSLRWRWAAFAVVLVLTLIALPATYSRGSMVATVVILPLSLLLARRRELVLLVTATVALVLWLSPPQLQQRVGTIGIDAARNDASGAQRMKSWYVATRIGLDYPLLGAGFRPFSEDVYEHYIPGYRDYHEAHSHFLQVLAAQGFTGLTLFVALLISVLARLWALMQRTKQSPESGWAYDYACMLALSLGAYIIGGVFIHLAYFELLYWLVVAAVLLDIVVSAPGGNEFVGESMIEAVTRRVRRFG